MHPLYILSSSSIIDIYICCGKRSEILMKNDQLSEAHFIIIVFRYFLLKQFNLLQNK